MSRITNLNSTARTEEKNEDEIEFNGIINLHDFERAARQKLPEKAWAYYSTGAEDEITLSLNRSIYSRIFFRPRVLVDVHKVDLNTSILGIESSCPFFIAPAAQGRLAHTEGEKLLARAAGRSGILQAISSSASLSVETITSSTDFPDQPFIFQLYFNKDRSKTEALIRRVHETGRVRAFFVTVDIAVTGKRETDQRLQARVLVESETADFRRPTETNRQDANSSLSSVIGSYIDPALSWKDLDWLRTKTNLPIVIKGIGTVEDAKRAVEWGADGIYLSNHGARNLDTSPPALQVLMELRRDCPHLFASTYSRTSSGRKAPEIYIDGGIRRGTDVVKALSLGARAVGIGRPFLFSLVWGQEGPEKVIDVLRDEIATTMKLIGVTKIQDLSPRNVNTKLADPFLSDPDHVSKL